MPAMNSGFLLYSYMNLDNLFDSSLSLKRLMIVFFQGIIVKMK